MEIIKKGIDTSRPMRCDVCGCEFKYLPGEVIHEMHPIYNVPPQYWSVNGGTYSPCDIRNVDVVVCPCCKTKCVIEEYDGTAEF